MFSVDNQNHTATIIKFFNLEQAKEFEDFLHEKNYDFMKEETDKPEVLFVIEKQFDISDFGFTKADDLFDEDFQPKRDKEYGHIVILEPVDYGNGFIVTTDINSPVAVKYIKKAIESVRTKTGLRKRLNSFISCLAKKSDRDNFKNGTWDFENKRLVSGDELYVLQWRVREKPYEPVGYENQQTTLGNVKIEYNFNES